MKGRTGHLGDGCKFPGNTKYRVAFPSHHKAVMLIFDSCQDLLVFLGFFFSFFRLETGQHREMIWPATPSCLHSVWGTWPSSERALKTSFRMELQVWQSTEHILAVCMCSLDHKYQTCIISVCSFSVLQWSYALVNTKLPDLYLFHECLIPVLQRWCASTRT